MKIYSHDFHWYIYSCCGVILRCLFISNHIALRRRNWFYYDICRSKSSNRIFFHTNKFHCCIVKHMHINFLKYLVFVGRTHMLKQLNDFFKTLNRFWIHHSNSVYMLWHMMNENYLEIQKYLIKHFFPHPHC